MPCPLLRPRGQKGPGVVPPRWLCRCRPSAPPTAVAAGSQDLCPDSAEVRAAEAPGAPGAADALGAWQPQWDPSLVLT